MRYFLLALYFSFQLSSFRFAHSAIFIVRHAERKSLSDDASKLSRLGKKRAKSLVKVLASADLKAIYVSEYERTKQTAAPTADAKKLTPVVINTEDAAGLLKAVGSHAPAEDILVVGHSDTIPELLKGLGVTRPVEIGKTDFDNLWVVTPSTPSAVPGFAWLHY